MIKNDMQGVMKRCTRSPFLNGTFDGQENPFQAHTQTLSLDETSSTSSNKQVKFGALTMSRY